VGNRTSRLMIKKGILRWFGHKAKSRRQPSNKITWFVVVKTVHVRVCVCVCVCLVQTTESGHLPVTVDSLSFVSDKFVDTGWMMTQRVNLICFVYWRCVCGKVESFTLTVEPLQLSL